MGDYNFFSFHLHMQGTHSLHHRVGLIICLIIMIASVCSQRLYVNRNCVINSDHPSDPVTCIEFEYVDCEDRLVARVFRGTTTVEGNRYMFPTAPEFSFIMPHWENAQVCHKGDFVIPITSTEPAPLVTGCLLLTKVHVEPSLSTMTACAKIIISGGGYQYPQEMCQEFAFPGCGTQGYYSPPCEHARSADVNWDRPFLTQLDTTRLTEAFYDIKRLSDDTLCVGARSAGSQNGQFEPFECLTLRADACNSDLTVHLFATGWTTAAVEVTSKDNQYCFGDYEWEYICVTFSHFNYDRVLREIVSSDLRISYTNENTVRTGVLHPNFDISLGGFSLHFPACGDSQCPPGRHTPVDWAVVQASPGAGLGSFPAAEQPIPVDDVPASSGNHDSNKGHHKDNKSNTTLIWVLSSLGIAAGVVLMMSILVLVVAVGHRRVRKKRGLLVHEPEDVFIEMDDASGFHRDCLQYHDDVGLEIHNDDVVLHHDSDSESLSDEEV